MSSDTSTNPGVIMPSSSGTDHSRYSNTIKSLIQYNVPSYLLEEEDDTRTKDDEDELTNRQEQESRARERRLQSSKAVKAAEKEFNDFKELLKLYKVADNVRTPSAGQQQAITDMNASVMNVTVAAGQDTMQHRIASKSLDLKKAVDEAQAAYDKDCKV